MLTLRQLSLREISIEQDRKISKASLPEYVGVEVTISNCGSSPLSSRWVDFFVSYVHVLQNHVKSKFVHVKAIFSTLYFLRRCLGQDGGNGSVEIGDEVEETVDHVTVTDEDGNVIFEKDYDPEVTKVCGRRHGRQILSIEDSTILTCGQAAGPREAKLVVGAVGGTETNHARLGLSIPHYKLSSGWDKSLPNQISLGGGIRHSLTRFLIGMKSFAD